MDNSESTYPELQEGERLLWSGRPENVQLLDSVLRARTIAIWAVCGALMLTGFAIAAAMKGSTLGQRAALVVIFDLIPFLAFFNTFRDANSLAKKTEYHISDRRVFVRTPYTEYAYEYSPKTPAEVGRENRSVRLGAAVGLKPQRERSVTLTNGLRDDGNHPLGVVLCNLSDPDGVLRMLRSAGAAA